MSCNSLNQHPQKYRLTYPEKDTVFYSNVPDKRYFEDVKIKCKTLDNTPTTCNQCSGTFQPWAGRSPNSCLENCTGIKTYKIDGCEWENMQNRTRRPGLACLPSPATSKAEYTNIAMIPPVFIAPGCQKDKAYFPPNPENYLNSDNKKSIIEYVFGCSYSY